MSVKVTVCTPERFGSCLELLYQHLAPARRAGQIEEARALLDRRNLVMAVGGSSLLGVLMVQPVAGGLGWIWPPALSPEAGELSSSGRRTAVALVRFGMRRLISAGSSLLQALVPVGGPELEVLQAAGLTRITDVVYLQRPLKGALPRRGSRLQFQASTAVGFQMLCRLVGETMQESLDCPELAACRRPDQMLASFRDQADFDPHLWLVAYRRGQPVGCALSAVAGGRVTGELQYMGVVPAARRSGVGRALVAEAMARLRAAGAERIELSVDRRNLPALELYQSLGFLHQDQRSLCIFVVDEVAA